MVSAWRSSESSLLRDVEGSEADVEGQLQSLVCVPSIIRLFDQGVETPVGFHLGQIWLKLCEYVQRFVNWRARNK